MGLVSMVVTMHSLCWCLQLLLLLLSEAYPSSRLHMPGDEMLLVKPPSAPFPSRLARFVGEILISFFLFCFSFPSLIRIPYFVTH
ncbi:hypothetical protein BGZ63DRAFT_228789 [Mariannaea sp. PMI_226]|nr:hypothetical protein BGZ63DRAFT_228789 [Mariannaea sp. PMI_226]